MPTIEIIEERGYYRANDIVVKADDSVDIKTSIPNRIFTVIISNKDGFFNLNESLIDEDVASASGKIVLGTVATGNGEVEKIYELHVDSASPIPVIDAPPRIIRVS